MKFTQVGAVVTKWSLSLAISLDRYGPPSSRIRFNEHIEEDGEAVFRHA
ncbi:MAG TPA: hypothetical protein VKG24_18695 [Pseudolabrys sp.]|jgi:hypothetical protein|nr:hypothetical protein [Pseudolabrys sp.]